MLKTKKILIALAVIGANVLHNMPVHTAAAANVYWYGKSGNVWTADENAAAASGVTITLTKDTTVGGSSALAVPNYFYAGYSKTANVGGNTLTLSGDSFNTTAQTLDSDGTRFYGGYGSDFGEHSVSGNTVNVTVSSMTATNGYFYIVGGENDYGTASENAVNMDGVIVNNEIQMYGAFIGNESTAVSDNQINVSNSIFNGEANFVGGCSYASVAGTLSGDIVTITDSTFNDKAYILGNMYGSDSAETTVSGGEVTINGATFKEDADIVGSMSGKGNATGGKVTVNSGEFQKTLATHIKGSYTLDGDATGGEVNILGGTFANATAVYGGHAEGAGDAKGNKVVFGTDGTKIGTDVNIYLYGGYAANGNAQNNIVSVLQDIKTENRIHVYGGLAGAGKDATGNTVNIGKADGTTVFQNAIFANIWGGLTGVMEIMGVSGTPQQTGNTLNVNAKINLGDGYIKGFDTFNFTVPAGMDTEMPIVKADPNVSVVALAGVTVSVDLNGLSLGADEFITLINSVDGTGYTPADGHYQVLTVDDAHYFLVYSGGTAPVTVDPDFVVVSGGNTYKADKFKGVYNDVFSATDLTGEYSGNTMDVAQGTFKNNVYGAVANVSTGNNTVDNNTINIKGGTFQSDNEMNIAGGYGVASESATLTVGGTDEASGNKLNISGGRFVRSDAELRLIGGMANSNAGSNGNYNTLNISGGTFEAGDEDHSIDLYGAYILGMNNGTSACNNKVVFGAEDTTISVAENSYINIFGAYNNASAMVATAGSNIISILSDTDKTSFVGVTGARFSGEYMSTPSVSDNVVNIGKDDGSTVFENMQFTSIVAGSRTGGTLSLSGNTLNVNAIISVTGDVGGFQNMNFTLPVGFGESDVMMTVGGTVKFDNTVIDISSSLPEGFVAVKGATLTLISANEFGGSWSSGTTASSLGTLKLEDNKLSLSLLDAPVSAKDLIMDVQVNSGDTLVLTGSGNDNILTKTISGAGGVQIGNGTDAAEVKTSANNLAVGGGVEVKTDAGLVVTDGELQQDVTNGGKVYMESGSSFGTDIKITGGEVYLKSGVEFSKDNLNTPSLLNLTDAVYNLSATLDGSTITLDKIKATNITGTLSLGDISLSGTSLTAGTYQASYITGTPASLTVNGTSAVTYNGQTYIFSQGVAEAGKLEILVENKVYTLKEVINGDSSGGFDPAKIDTYVMAGDYTADTELGTLNKATGTSSRTLTVDGDGTYKLLGNGHNGVTVNTDDILTLQNIAEISGWNSYAVDNSGTVNFAGDVTLGTGAVMQGNGTYNNNGTLTTSAENLQMPSPSGLVNNGTLILKDGTLTAKITGTGTITIDGNVTTANTINLGSTGTLTVLASKVLELTGGTLDKAIANEGTVKLNGAGLDGAYVTAGTLEFAADLTTNADYVAAETNVVDSGKTLTLTDGTLAAKVEGAGNLTFAGNVTSNADNIKTAGTNTVNSDKTLTLTGDGTGDDTLTVAIGGAGNIVFDGNVSTNADNIGTTGTNTVNSGKTLTFTGGALTQTIGGAGSIVFDADISVSAAKLANTGTNTVNEGKTLTITDGTLAQTVAGAGNLVFAGDMSVSAKKLTNTGINTISDGKTLTITDGNLAQTIAGGGNLVFAGDMSVSAIKLTNTGTKTVNSDKTLTITDGSLTSNITNNGTVSMATGSSFGTGGKISGGAVTFGNDVSFTKDNLENVTTLSLNGAVYGVTGALDDTAGIVLDTLSVNGISGTITLGDINLTGSTFDSWTEDTTKQIQFITATGTNTLTITGEETVEIDGYNYTFSQAYEVPGGAVKYGYFDVLKEIADQRTLQERLAQDNGDIKYTLKANETVAGTLQLRDIAGSVPRTLTLVGKSGGDFALVAQNDSSIVKNNNADILTLQNLKAEGFDTAISNSTSQGTVNLKSVNFVGTKTMDVVNNGTLNILDNQVNFAKGVTGTGIMNVKDNLTVGTGTIIEQNTINVDAGKNLTNNGTITINNGSLNGDGATALTNVGAVIINNGNLNTKVAGGVLEFAGESSVEKAEYIAGNTNRIRSESKLKLANETDGELNAILEGDGEVVVDSAIDATNGEIKTKVTVNESKSLKIDADKLGNVVTNNGTLNLSGTGDNILNHPVGGTGQTVITGNGTVTLNAPVTNSGGITVEANNTLKAAPINIGANITNAGTVKLAGISGDYVETLNYSITGGTLEVVSGTFDFTDVSKISGVDSLKLTEGTVVMNADALFTNNSFNTKTALGNNFMAIGGTLNLNNFDGNTFTATQYKNAQTALGANMSLVMMGELALETDEKLVIEGANAGSGAVTLSNVKPKVVDPVAGIDVTIPAVPQNYVPVTASGSTNLLKADTITVGGGSNFIAKGLQIDDLYSEQNLKLVVTGDNTKLTLTGGDGETGVVKADSSKKVPVSLTVENNAEFNAGAAAVGNHNELEFKDITIDNAKMNVVGNNVTAPELKIKNKGWLVVDPAYMKVDTLNIEGGAIQVVTDGAVFAQGYVTNELRSLVERAGVSTIDSGDGFTVPYGTGVMALRNSSSSSSNIKINKTAGDHLAITADPSYNPTTAPMLKIDSGALLVLDGSMGQDSSVNAIIELENSVAGDVSISDNAKVFVAGANAKGVGVYKLLYGGAVDKAANYFGGHIYTDNPLYKITLLPPEEQIDNTFAFKLTQNEENTAFSAENLGITRGAYDVSNMVGDAITTHFATKEKSEKLWATFVHNKDKVDGLGISNTTAKYDAQFNGTVVGYDLVDDKDITLGLLLGYIDGNTSNSTGHNDSKYHSLGIYGRKNIGKFQLQGDITYLHGKNETDMTVEDLSVKADAKTNTYSIGVKGELPYKVGKGTIAPFAGVRYIRIDGKEYSNNLNMQFKAEKVNSFVVPIGVRYSTEINNFYGWKVKPEVAVGYVSNLGTKRNQMNITHERAHSSYEYDVVDKHAVFAKAGLSMSKKNFTVGVGYDYSKSSHSHNNKWNVNMNWSF